MDISTLENSLHLITGIIGTIAMVLLFFSIRPNKLVNFFFLLITAIISFRALMRGTYGFQLQSYANDFMSSYRGISLFVLPLFYLYFKGLTSDQKKIIWPDLLHLVFPLTFIVFLSISSHFHWQHLFLVKSFNLFITITFTLVYLVFSWRLIYKEIVITNSSNHRQHQKLLRNWSIFLLTLSTLQITRLIISLFLDFSQANLLTGYPFSVVSSIFWLAIFGKILITPEILFGLPKLTQRLQNNKNEGKDIRDFWNSQVTQMENQNDFKMRDKMDTKVMGLIQEIEQVITTKHFFKNPKISISDLATEIGVPVSHLVYFFKYHCKVTFTEFKTIHKIDHAKELIDTGFLSTNTLESLAAEIGFSSYNPFFMAFKKYTNQSPNDYYRSTNKVLNRN
jgi:AraC-like DNA-binding protein